MIEHNLDVIDGGLGGRSWPEGGEGGGQIVAAGTPEEVANVPGSFTGQYLRRILAR